MAAIRGLRQALNQLKRIRQEADDTVRRVLDEGTKEILDDALIAVPVRDGTLKASGGREVAPDGKSARVYFNARHAPYVEFGTGPLTQVPIGYEDYAMTFFENGEGNTTPKPYLFPAGLKFTAQLDQRLQEAFAKLNPVT